MQLGSVGAAERASFSTYVENIDLNSAQLCDRCRAELRADAARGMVSTSG